MDDHRARGHASSIRRTAVIGVVGWVVIVALALAWQGIGVIAVGDRFPSLTEILRAGTRHAWSRWLLFGLWLWIGWHLFVNRWQEFFRT